MRTAFAAVILCSLSACATTPSTRTLVVRQAPNVSDFHFDTAAPMMVASEFAPWAALTAVNRAENRELESCIGDRDLCATRELARYRRLLEVAAVQPATQQLKLVHEYFNSIEQTLEGHDGISDFWASLYRIVSTHRGDCKAIALGKYFTLRRLGWPAEDLRVVMEWDDREHDWHALLAVRDDDRTYMLDSILGLQKPRAFGFGYMVYSISELGVWDHAPDFVPVP